MSALARSPLPGPLTVTSAYGARVHPVTGKASFHAGVDLRAATGTDLVAPGPGRVVMADDAGDDADDTGGVELVLLLDNGWRIGFAHLLGTAVAVGERVAAGDWIASTGNTGTSTTGAHLHVTLRAPNGERVDPWPHIRDAGRCCAVRALGLGVVLAGAVAAYLVLRGRLG